VSQFVDPLLGVRETPRFPDDRARALDVLGRCLGVPQDPCQSGPVGLAAVGPRADDEEGSLPLDEVVCALSGRVGIEPSAENVVAEWNAIPMSVPNVSMSPSRFAELPPSRAPIFSGDTTV